MTDSCQVDFYVLSSASLNADRMACRLALMSWERGHRTLIVTESENSAKALDKLMWESPSQRFVPHDLESQADSHAPILITNMENNGDPATGEENIRKFDVVINLSPQPVPNPGRFVRLLEIVPQEDVARKASRGKFKYYRDLGITPGSHEISK